MAAHGITAKETVLGLVLGHGSIEHRLMPIRAYDDVLQLFAKTGTRWCPTIGAFGGNGLLFAKEPYLLSDPSLRAHTSPSDYDLVAALDLDPAAMESAEPETTGKLVKVTVVLRHGLDSTQSKVIKSHFLIFIFFRQAFGESC